MKTCSKCKQRKAATEFRNRRDSSDGLSHQCKKCLGSNDAARYDRNRAAMVVAARQHRRRYRDKICKRRRELHQKNYPRNKEKIAKRNAAWLQQHPEKNAAYVAKRRALRLNAPVVEHVDRRKVYDRDKGRCHLCKKRVSFKRMHLDHVIPLSRNGEHSYRNIKVACPKCNSKKSNKLPCR